METIDAIDRKIISRLQKDAKQSIKELAHSIGMTKTPVYERIKKLEKAGIIEKYIAVVDQRKLINGMFVFCSVSLEVQKLKEIEIFKEEVRKLPEVLECYLMGGVNDFLLKVMVKDLEAYHQFSSGKLAALDNVSQIKSTFVLDEVKKQ
ncbi:Lrp/AsnC family transcriptional regulator [Brumimicrobium aurantiacum]|uniref:Lrp/AsnC family transcriptional regulator n=1 Tax=Brumimicrobium aurantiacum TaxID=1737063 RepID=A0A3E1EWP6_9FLAO|nr:Lrp/AsnC family transcriptional regulator [Brumimicrobium aurantiacum]RFC53913.1 Lrp/AsnC family transcriptional regulator [Brumimicrobium aurantiacum]